MTLMLQVITFISRQLSCFLKSKRCLTEKEELELSELAGDSELNITSQSELVRRLEELQRFKRLSSRLMSLSMRGEMFLLNQGSIKRK